MPDFGVLLLVLAGLIIAAAVYAVYRGIDVRLALSDRRVRPGRR